MSGNKLISSDKKGVFTLVEACKFFGIKNVFISPGSRNAPLSIAFHRSGYFNCHSIADERSAAFYAMGMAIGTGLPTAVICTSGSAAINLAPAMAEAFYLKIPLIAVTADRPTAWVDQGNGQTIRQKGLFSNFSVAEIEVVSEPRTDDDEWLNRRKLSELFNSSILGNKGPAHINVPIAEPLYNTLEYPAQNLRFYRSILPEPSVSIQSLSEIIESFTSGKKMMILVGQRNTSAKLNEDLSKLSKLNNVVILSETTANIDRDYNIDTIDRLVMSITEESQVRDLMPEVLITTQGYVVSKKIKALLRQYAPKEHWHISSFDSGLDTYRSLTGEIKANPTETFAIFAETINKNPRSDYRSKWMLLKEAAELAHKKYIAEVEFSDFSAFGHIQEFLERGMVLHMANSSPVRYVQLYGKKDGVEYYANRGTSGIDGCTSTAAGIALAQGDKSHFLVTGDVAFNYDSNAVWNKNFPKNLKIILINNSGGGIFRIIQGPDTTPELEEFFEAHHKVDFKHLALAHGFEYFHAEDAAGTVLGLNNLKQSQNKAILEISTPQERNAPVLKNYFKHIGKVLNKY